VGASSGQRSVCHRSSGQSVSAASTSRSASSKLLAMLCTNGFATPYVISHIDGSGERQLPLNAAFGISAEGALVRRVGGQPGAFGLDVCLCRVNSSDEHCPRYRLRTGDEVDEICKKSKGSKISIERGFLNEGPWEISTQNE
jgi:hypothetical protein